MVGLDDLRSFPTLAILCFCDSMLRWFRTSKILGLCHVLLGCESVVTSVGKVLKAHPSPTPCHGPVAAHQIRVPRAPSSQTLGTLGRGHPHLLFPAFFSK